MIHAYQETYLNKAQTTLGEAFDYAFNDCGISIKDLNSIIVNSEIISRFEQGDPAIIAGKSGPEIIIDIFYQAKNEYIKKTPEIKYSRSAEYWIGWIISKTVEILDEKLKEHFKQTKLCTLRKICGYSQSQLSKKAGVSLRSIQMYEQRQKNINKASVQTLYSICKVLGCNIDDLLEKHPY